MVSDWVEIVKVGVGAILSLASIALSVLMLVMVWTMFRWFVGYLGLTRGPVLTRQVGGRDVRKSRRGSELPPARMAARRLWCRHLVTAVVRTQEGREKLCVSCGRDMWQAEPERWV